MQPYNTIVDALADIERSIGRFVRLDRTLHLRSIADTEEHQEIQFRVYTRVNSYCITIKAPTAAKPQGYMGCQSSSRTPRAGESHTRGSDLADGACTRETWLRILGDIVSYELVALADRVPVLPLGALPEQAPGLPASASA